MNNDALLDEYGLLNNPTQIDDGGLGLEAIDPSLIRPDGRGLTFEEIQRLAEMH